MATSTDRRSWTWLRSLAISIALAVTAVVLVVLDLRVDWQRRDVAELAASAFDPSWLDRDAQPPRLFEEKLPAYVRDTMRRFPSLRSVYVTRATRGYERLIYPDREYRRFAAVREGALRVPLRDVTGTTGYLYFDFDPAHGAALHVALRSVLAVVVLGGAALLIFLRRQAKAIASTRIELAEKTRELYHLERLALVGRLSAGVLHDLKKPMLNIRDDAESIADASLRAAIREQATLFFAILRELDLEGFLSRSEERAEFVDLEEVVERSYKMVERQGRGVHFELDFPNHAVLVLAMKHRLVQVFSNLFLNALQAMPDGGSLGAQCRIVAKDAGREAIVEVTDTGCGISPERLPTIFEPFASYSGVEGSTGLGLYITRSLVRDLGGEVDVRSTVGDSTTFTVRLPLEEPPLRSEGPIAGGGRTADASA